MVAVEGSSDWRGGLSLLGSPELRLIWVLVWRTWILTSINIRFHSPGKSQAWKCRGRQPVSIGLILSTVTNISRCVATICFGASTGWVSALGISCCREIPFTPTQSLGWHLPVAWTDILKFYLLYSKSRWHRVDIVLTVIHLFMGKWEQIAKKKVREKRKEREKEWKKEESRKRERKRKR